MNLLHPQDQSQSHTSRKKATAAALSSLCALYPLYLINSTHLHTTSYPNKTSRWASPFPVVSRPHILSRAQQSHFNKTAQEVGGCVLCRRIIIISRLNAPPLIWCSSSSVQPKQLRCGVRKDNAPANAHSARPEFSAFEQSMRSVWL